MLFVSILFGGCSDVGGFFMSGGCSAVVWWLFSVVLLFGGCSAFENFCGWSKFANLAGRCLLKILAVVGGSSSSGWY